MVRRRTCPLQPVLRRPRPRHQRAGGGAVSWSASRDSRSRKRWRPRGAGTLFSPAAALTRCCTVSRSTSSRQVTARVSWASPVPPDRRRPATAPSLPPGARRAPVPAARPRAAPEPPGTASRPARRPRSGPDRRPDAPDPRLHPVPYERGRQLRQPGPGGLVDQMGGQVPRLVRRCAHQKQPAAVRNHGRPEGPREPAGRGGPLGPGEHFTEQGDAYGIHGPASCRRTRHPHRRTAPNHSNGGRRSDGCRWRDTLRSPPWRAVVSGHDYE